MTPATPRIRLLADSLINQIAAGEVIERPASVVKELVENSLDAGAGAIAIELVGGGVERISVRDDGRGIAADDLPLALARHCTSKIAQAADLDAIRTLGFRGEALASIASVAELELTSRVRDAEHAWRVRAGPAAPVVKPQRAAHGPGTSVVVSELFARVPARRRFLKRAATEQLHIHQLVRRIAFCMPAASLSLSCDGQRALVLPAATDERSAERRWRGLFGADFAREARFLDCAAHGLRLFGWIGPADLARGQADLQWLAVNGRLVRDRSLAHAIRAAFEDRLPEGRFAAFALHLEMPPDEVDVNVHPGKLEVRFARLRDVHDLVHAATRRALADDRHPLPQSAAGGAEPRVEDAAPPAIRFDTGSNPPRESASLRTVVGAVGERMLVEVTPDALIVHAAGALAAAVVRRRLEQQSGARPPTRPLLFPIRVVDEGGCLTTERRAALAACGFELDAVGPQIHVLRTLPTMVPELEPDYFSAALIGALADPRTAVLDAVGSAVAAAASLPRGTAERGTWLARMLEQAQQLALDPARYCARLDEAALHRLLDRA